ncbi:hypothetical protein [Herbidospora daliensis]|uniref:hypothetical protein n=1 Tax=Herbidospora daliensis TaxID=295585 RepID=UPI0007850886|nr:hypothetical protein [Herbidospora daliensis]
MLSSATADTKTVTYSCAASLNGAAIGTGVDYDVVVNLTAATAATVGTPFPASVALSGDDRPAAPVAIPTTVQIQVITEIEVKGNGGAAAVATTVAPTATLIPTAEITQGATLPPLPTVTASITPSTGTTQLTLTAKNFTIRLMGTGGTTELGKYVCSLPAAGGAVTPTPASATLSVTTASTTPSPTPTPSTTPTPTPSTTPTPRATRTVTETATAPAPDDQVETPDGGVATGGGGMLGPDGRVFVLTGSAIVLAAGIGGLMLRSRRRPQQG